MDVDPRILIAIGDVFLNLSAGWFGLVFITPAAYTRSLQENLIYIIGNTLLGIIALGIGYKLRIIGA